MKESLDLNESATQTYRDLLLILRDDEEEPDESHEPTSLIRFVAMKIVK